MKPLLLCYPKCSTCKKAVKWLEEQGVEVQYRDIVIENPNEIELSAWVERSKLPVSRFFNTSGLRYRALQLKDKVKVAPSEELISILATEGMLVKRPLLVLEDGVLLGFKEKEWNKILLK